MQLLSHNPVSHPSSIGTVKCDVYQAEATGIAYAHTSCENVHSGSRIRLHLRLVRLLAHAAVALWRYRAKSKLREELNASDVTRRCLMDDRTPALDDQVTGTVARAKHPRMRGVLFDYRAAFVVPPGADHPTHSFRRDPVGWGWSLDLRALARSAVMPVSRATRIFEANAEGFVPAIFRKISDSPRRGIPARRR